MSKRTFEKKPLFRKVNSKTHGVRHGGGEYRWQRNSKREAEQPERSMHSKRRNGLDYTPLFKFLVSKVGQQWDQIFPEAVSRLDDTEPVFWLVSIDRENAREIVRCGESSYFSGLFVDEVGVLRKTNPDLTAKTMTPYCHCCTHTFNGEVFGIKKTLDDFRREWSQT